MAYMAGQSGGYGMLRFTKWDVYNYVHWQRVVQKLNDDAAATITIYANFEISEFDEYWKASVESLGLDDNNWVKCTYECRESWAMAYLRETFCAGYRTTSRCEGINAFIKGFLKSTDSILELMHSLDWVVKDYRNNELYTRAVFREVKKQIKGVATLLFRGKDSIGMTTVYTFSRMGKPNKTHKVLIDPNEEKIECECSMWNSEGIPCSHIFCAMKYEGLEEIPPGLILRRWCKEAKDRRSTPVDSKDGPEGHLLRYGALCGAMSLVAQLGAEDAAEFVVARDRMRLPVSPKRFSGEGFTGLGANSVYHRWPGSRTPWYQRQRGHPGRERSPNRLVRVTGCRRDDVVPTVRLRVTRRGLARGTGERVLQGSPSYVEHGSHYSAAPYATPQTRHCHTNEEGLQPDNGNPGDTPPAQPDGTTPSIAHGCSSPFCRNPVGVGGARANFFLGGQHIEQFYTTKSCSGHIAQPSTQAANPSFGNLNAWTNKDLFERWLRQTAVGRMAGTRKPGSVPKQ
ncbi:hypothetical protein Ahy_B03g067028 [Arachis hypogaea]|uniref:SWIM-type domain-containing protein n=1 Tax=Arachis hypogaea TaxID=3818 RepID=A0A445A5G9_ARAHY|nr:hypothetical protein Ahy_B03g067028 [Arachis hypogaea]